MVKQQMMSSLFLVQWMLVLSSPFVKSWTVIPSSHPHSVQQRTRNPLLSRSTATEDGETTAGSARTPSFSSSEITTSTPYAELPLDGFGVTTKTNKRLIFDDKQGRFFETSLEPTIYATTEAVTSVYTSKYVEALPSINIKYDTTKYAVTDMIPTEVLFGQERLPGSNDLGDEDVVNMECDRELLECETIYPPPEKNGQATLAINDEAGDDDLDEAIDEVDEATDDGIDAVDEVVDEIGDAVDEAMAEIDLGIFAKAPRRSENLDPEPLLSSQESGPQAIILKCYDAWNRQDMTAAAACFDDTNLSYQDSLFYGKITKTEDLQQHFQHQAEALPSNSKLVVDHMAADPTNNNIAAEWHVEAEDGSVVPLTRGISFYTVATASGKIQTGFRVSEMLVKPPKGAADALVSSASAILRNSETNNSQNKNAKTTVSSSSLSSSSSIIEQYFEAWNQHDMKAALDCFTEDCTYQTEDPVFVDTFRGKEALRKHLEKNAQTLPAFCQIILDQLAIDPVSGNIGTTWHLEAAPGVSIPNLRGCSMYTTDPKTGLLRTGFDVTEAPVKVPRQAMSLLSRPIGQFLFGRR